MLRKSTRLHSSHRTISYPLSLGLFSELRVSLLRRLTHSHPSSLFPYTTLFRSDIVRILSDKAAIDLQAFLRVPLRDVELRQHLSIGDIPGDFYRQRASCTG